MSKLTTIEISGDHDQFDPLPSEAEAVYRIIVWDTDENGNKQKIVHVAEAQSIPGQCDAIATLRREIKKAGGPDQKPAAFRAAYAKALARFNEDYPNAQ